MIVVRDVFQAKYGHGGELVELFKEGQQKWSADMAMGFAQRILTDASGPFFTVITETEIDSMAAWEQESVKVFARPDFAAWFARMMPLVENGRREFYHLEV